MPEAPVFGPSPTIQVDPARTISGVVRDAETGEPVAGARGGACGGSDSFEGCTYRVTPSAFAFDP